MKAGLVKSNLIFRILQLILLYLAVTQISFLEKKILQEVVFCAFNALNFMRPIFPVFFLKTENFIFQEGK